ncbi:MAG: serine/threonine-protein kinase, partial [Dehalococcoidia bacterium]
MASERIQRRIERLLDQIEAEADQRNWEEVHQLARQILGFAPDNTDALAFLTVAEQSLLPAGQTTAPVAAPMGTPAPEVSAPSLDQPTSFANGRYEVKRFLGEGGRKKVYLAHDSLLDRDVAFALIKTEGLDEVSRTRITREAQAMGRLGSHPHIVTVFDLGEHPSVETGQASQPYMVTELMGGGDLEGVVEDAPDHRLPLEQAISIAQETCQGLEFAHSRGIVHRDLKPGNVWLTAEGVAKIGDFGLAVAIDRSRLTSEGMMVGTVSYMPPEQAMGGEVTPRADLYSLGAMLYEMVTGRPPFLGDDTVAIIGQHINTPPVAPTWHCPECPRPLEALILRLLAKDPAERPASATDVLAALESLDLTVPTDIFQSAEESHTLDSLAGGVFVGRQREMGDLKAALEDALSGRGRLVTLVGEPGIGKTRTAQELATYAGLRGGQVLWGRCYEEQGMPPYWPWVQAIRSYVREQDPEQLRSEMGTGAADIAEVVSDVKERLPDLRPPPQMESPEQARFRLFDSITAFL